MRPSLPNTGTEDDGDSDSGSLGGLVPLLGGLRDGDGDCDGEIKVLDAIGVEGVGDTMLDGDLFALLSGDAGAAVATGGVVGVVGVVGVGGVVAAAVVLVVAGFGLMIGSSNNFGANRTNATMTCVCKSRLIFICANDAELSEPPRMIEPNTMPIVFSSK
jgi:hypothetical protein